MKDIIQLLLDAPDGQLDECIKPKIREWSDPPTALQILEVLDQCVHASLCSGFVITVFETLLKKAIESEGTTYNDVVSKATWRN